MNPVAVTFRVPRGLFLTTPLHPERISLPRETGSLWHIGLGGSMFFQNETGLERDRCTGRRDGLPKPAGQEGTRGKNWKETGHGVRPNRDMRKMPMFQRNTHELDESYKIPIKRIAG